MVNVLIVDDHPVVVEGLRKLFCEAENRFSCAIAYSIAECYKALKVFTPDIILLDINLPDGSGIDLCSKIRLSHPNTKILALSSFSDRSFISRMLANGANGYLLKSSSEEEIFEAVSEVLAGQTHIGSDVSEIINNTSNATDSIKLTRREIEVLKLIAEGLTNVEIADKLFISFQTVDSHRKNLFKKLDAKNRASLINIAIHKGYI